MKLANTAEQPTPESLKQQPETPTIEDVVAEIGRDARVNPGAYLRDSLVPEGGE